MQLAAKLKLFLVFFLIAGVATACTRQEPDPTSRIIEECKKWMASQSAMDETESRDNFAARGSGACISGDLDDDVHEKVFAWLDEVPSQTKPVVVIRSGGGDAFPAIDIAEALQQRDAAVYVYDVCASGCANYIYAGVRNRHSIGATILLFHGGLTKETAQEMGEVFDSLLNSAEGKNIENPALERKQWIERAELYLKKQDELLVAAGVDPMIIHGFNEMEMSDLASADCDPEREPDLEYSVFFSKDTAKALGILPITGSLEYRANIINERLNRGTKGNKACVAPAKFFQPAQ
jgi:ATP-dependent protease ClpP protease subunit